MNDGVRSCCRDGCSRCRREQAEAKPLTLFGCPVKFEATLVEGPREVTVDLAGALRTSERPPAVTVDLEEAHKAITRGWATLATGDEHFEVSG